MEFHHVEKNMCDIYHMLTDVLPWHAMKENTSSEAWLE